MSAVVSDAAARQSPMEAVRRSIRKFEDNRYAVMKQRNIIGQVCHTPKSYDNVMHVGLRKVTFKWQRGNKIGACCPTIAPGNDGGTGAGAGCDAVFVFVGWQQVKASTEKCTPALTSTLEN